MSCLLLFLLTSSRLIICVSVWRPIWNHHGLAHNCQNLCSYHWASKRQLNRLQRSRQSVARVQLPQCCWVVVCCVSLRCLPTVSFHLHHHWFSKSSQPHIVSPLQPHYTTQLVALTNWNHTKQTSSMSAWQWSSQFTSSRWSFTSCSWYKICLGPCVHLLFILNVEPVYHVHPNIELHNHPQIFQPCGIAFEFMFGNPNPHGPQSWCEPWLCDTGLISKRARSLGKLLSWLQWQFCSHSSDLC